MWADISMLRFVRKVKKADMLERGPEHVDNCVLPSFRILNGCKSKSLSVSPFS